MKIKETSTAECGKWQSDLCVTGFSKFIGKSEECVILWLLTPKMLCSDEFKNNVDMPFVQIVKVHSVFKIGDHPDHPQKNACLMITPHPTLLFTSCFGWGLCIFYQFYPSSSPSNWWKIPRPYVSPCFSLQDSGKSHEKNMKTIGSKPIPGKTHWSPSIPAPLGVPKGLHPAIHQQSRQRAAAQRHRGHVPRRLGRLGASQATAVGRGTPSDQATIAADQGKDLWKMGRWEDGLWRWTMCCWFWWSPKMMEKYGVLPFK